MDQQQEQQATSIGAGPPPKTVAVHLDEFGRPAAGSAITTLALPPENFNFHVPPAIEREHVHKIYDTIADHWSNTRYKAWPKYAPSKKFPEAEQQRNNLNVKKK